MKLSKDALAYPTIIAFYDRMLWLPRKLHHWFAWKSSDYYLISFPKAGRTWLRVFLACYFHRMYKVPLNIDFRFSRKRSSGMPRIYFSHSGIIGEVWHKQREGYIFDDIDMLRKSIKELYKNRIILLARDPRDIVNSYFFYMKNRLGREDVPSSVSEFIRHKLFGIRNIISYYNLWYEHRNNFHSLVILRYEDLQSDPTLAFRILLRQLGVPWNQHIFKEAYSYSSFNNMQRLEEEGIHPSYLGQTRKNATKNERHVRSGRVGEFLEHFSEDDVMYANAMLTNLNPIFGYHSS